MQGLKQTVICVVATLVICACIGVWTVAAAEPARATVERVNSRVLIVMKQAEVAILDEPTSGLDSFRATQIVKLLCDLAHKKHKTVMATIHQPNSQAFALFDRLILLMDGYCVY